MLIPGNTYKIIYNKHCLIVKYIKDDLIYNFDSEKTIKSSFIYYVNHYLKFCEKSKNYSSRTELVIDIKNISKLIKSTFKHHFI